MLGVDRPWRQTAAIVALILTTACTANNREGDTGRSSPALKAHRATVAGIRLYPSPLPVLQACQKAQASAPFAVLCPTVLPRPFESSSFRPGTPPQPIGAQIYSLDRVPYGMSFMYQAPFERDLERNRPDRFLHFEVYRRSSDCCGGPSRTAHSLVLGGKIGLLLRANGRGPYFGNHVRFFFAEGGVSYVATLHTFGPGTTALLAALVAGLRPTRSLSASPSASLEAPEGTATIAVPGSGPAWVVAHGDTLWVGSLGDLASVLEGRPGSVVARLDSTAGRLEGRLIQLRTPPYGLAVTKDTVWTALLPRRIHQPFTLLRIDRATGEVVTEISVGVGIPTSVAANGGAVWVSDYGDGVYRSGTIWHLDPVTARALARIPVGGGPVSVAAAKEAVWVANYLDDTVSRIDPARDHVVATVPVGAGPTAVAVGVDAVWVANYLDDTVSRIDPETNRVTATIPVEDGPMGIAVTSGDVWVTSYQTDSLGRIDPMTNRVVASYAVGAGPIGVAVEGDTVWVANDLEGTLTRITISIPFS